MRIGSRFMLMYESLIINVRRLISCRILCRVLHVVHLTLRDTGDTHVITKRAQFIPRL